MKKYILILITFTGIATYSHAQVIKTDYRDNLLFGFKAGLNYSNVYDAQGDKFQADAKYGFAAGAFLSIPFGRFIGIQPEILFSQKGFKASGILLGSPYSLTRTTNFIDVPLFFAFKPIQFVTLLAGPQFSYLTRQKDVYTNGGLSSQQETEFNNDNLRKNILCGVVGADINIDHVVLSARAGWDIQNNNGNGSSNTPRYKNVWYQATVGYRF